MHVSYLLNETQNSLRVGFVYLLSNEEHQLEGQTDQALA